MVGSICLKLFLLQDNLFIEFIFFLISKLHCFVTSIKI